MHAHAVKLMSSFPSSPAVIKASSYATPHFCLRVVRDAIRTQAYAIEAPAKAKKESKKQEQGVREWVTYPRPSLRWIPTTAPQTHSGAINGTRHSVHWCTELRENPMKTKWRLGQTRRCLLT